MNRLQIIAVLGCVALGACSAADDVTERPAADAGRDVKTTARPDVQAADQLDASGGSYADEASTVPDPDVTAPDATSPPPDGAVPPPDTISPPPDGTLPPPNDATPPPLLDAAPDQTASSCVVTFTVNGVQWNAPEGGADAQVTGRVVRLVGDATNIGAWTPAAGVLLTQTASGVWSGTATFRDQQLTEFKFVKLEGTTPEWESWLPFDSNRSLRVECFGEGGVLRDVAAADSDVFTVTDGAADRAGDHDGPLAADIADVQDSGAPSDTGVVTVPARVRAYVGVFGVRPLDATK